MLTNLSILMQMKKKNTAFLELSIDQPCSEPWAGMQPEKHGRYCFQCSKVVRDFTQATDAELADFFRTGPSGVCGRFRPEQLRRPLGFTPVYDQRRTAPWRSAALVGGLMLGAGLASAQGTVPQIPYLNAGAPAAVVVTKMGELRVVQNPQIAPRKISGNITDEQGEVLIGVNIVLVGTKLGTVSDFDGHFELVIPDTLQKFALDISYMGYDSQTVTVDWEKDPEIPTLDLIMEEAYRELDDIIVVAGYVICTPVQEPPVEEPEETMATPFPELEMPSTIALDDDLLVFPNPFRDVFTIRFNAPQEGKYAMQLWDASGRLLEQYTTHFIAGDQQLSPAFELEELAPGNYLLRMQAEDGKLYWKQLVKAAE